MIAISSCELRNRLADVKGACDMVLRPANSLPQRARSSSSALRLL